MKKLLVTVLCAMAVIAYDQAYAVNLVSETSGKARVGYVSVSTSVVTEVSSAALVTSHFAINICNEGAVGASKLRCGYTTTVSTITANVNLGFWVKPQECEYRAVYSKIYCLAEGATAISISRELFGTP